MGTKKDLSLGEKMGYSATAVIFYGVKLKKDYGCTDELEEHYARRIHPKTRSNPDFKLTYQEVNRIMQSSGCQITSIGENDMFVTIPESEIRIRMEGDPKFKALTSYANADQVQWGQLLEKFCTTMGEDFEPDVYLCLDESC